MGFGRWLKKAGKKYVLPGVVQGVESSLVDRATKVNPVLGVAVEAVVIPAIEHKAKTANVLAGTKYGAILTPTENNMEIKPGFVTTEFWGAIAGAITAIGACFAAWQSHDIPVNDKVNLTIAAFTAISVVWGIYTHGRSNQKTEAIKADAQVSMTAMANVPVSAPTVPAQPPLSDRPTNDDLGPNLDAPVIELKAG